ncbi:MAG TPA: FAD-dependent oxidoreductase [Streptosporangiaceae bacterium]|jgi:thioredoxin reductase (NADPH)|nr:FAD-dependent oxidoreductase [Streptosporangiaceae bacterium]
MAKPVLILVDDEDAGRHALARELESRYGAHYRIVSSPSPESALARLTGFRDEGVAVPLVLADHWMPGMTGTEFLARVREIVPTARRGLLVTWGDWSTTGPILEALALGQVEFYVPRPVWSPDEQFHRTITEWLEEWWREQGGRFEAVTVIGDEPSARIHEIRDLLARNNVPFGFYRSDSAEGRQALARLGIDQPAGPVVALFNGFVLVDPGNVEVAEALRRTDVRPPGQGYDVVIVGAGPAGLAAAVSAASEGLATALLELEAFGGQAGTSSRIRNYLGFPRGISGAELALRASEQAWGFGTHFIYGKPATSLAADEGVHVVGLRDGSQIRSRAVIIATGVSYRRLGIAELESLAGAGVFYGASTVEARAVAGKPVFVVGGGNSAGQAALHLAKYAEQVTLLVRSPSLAASMSDYLTREIGSAANVHVRYRSEVAGGGGNGRLEHLLIRDRDSGRTESLPAAGLFILIGAQPFTGWLPGAIARDQWGFILTGPDAAPRWPLPRAPFPFETTAPGVFAVGDVRHGSVKRVASAVGEGSIAIRLVHDYLALAP